MVNECIDLLRARQIASLRGNHDQYLVTRTRCPRSFSANLCLDYQQRIIADTNLEWLSTLPLFLAWDDLSAVHGGWNDYLDEYMDILSPEYFKGRATKFFTSGHTHVQILLKFGEGAYCNPGAVGQPRDGDPRAAYATYDSGNFVLRRVPYDIEQIVGEMRLAKFDPRITENLYRGTQIGGKITAITFFSENNTLR
jgi:diadenosine tetraphosphatase ApaH/serine/threonine PP2A family protein phosphatase